MRYTNKFVQFLANGNTIKVSGMSDFKSLNTMIKKVGLELPWKDYWELYSIAQNNNCVIGNSILVEYQSSKGFAIGWKSIDQSKEWFGLLPWGVKEVKQDMEPKEVIEITCYGKTTTYTNRTQAKKFYSECFAWSEGCERERYANILYQLDEGLTKISDEY